MKRALVVLVAVLSISCGGDSDGPPAGPTLAPAPAPSTFALAGTVRDSQTNAPLATVNVEILDGPAANRSAATDASGNYTFAGLTPAGFNVRFSRSGYTSADRGVNLTQDVRLDVSLAPVPPPPPPPPTGGTPPSSWPGTLPSRTSGSHPVCQATLPAIAACVNDIVGRPEAICDDSRYSCSTGSGTCSGHGGVYCWRN